ncbi:MAG TPA: hypothetical protein VK576_04245, partial [Thermoleophilia bacterium]|nr:hypothetical protein [Thermoleophilia bacterium]
MSDRQDNPTAAFDDDRLLDYVLGLEDDPELAAALAASAPLRERLADLKADLAAIESELREAIPAIDDSYAAPGSGRWPRLQRFFGGETARRRPLQGRRLAATLAAAAVLVALLIGFVSVLPRIRTGSPGSSSGSASGLRAPALGASGATEKSNDHATTGVASVPSPAAVGGTVAIAGLAGRYRDIAVVRAGTAAASRQPFTVARVLKGAPPARFTLTVGPSRVTAVPGSLQLVFLRPVASTST